MTLRGRLVVTCLMAAAAVAGRAEPAAAQGDRYAVLVQGASGEDQYATLHRGWIDQMAARLRDDFGFDPAKVQLLVEQPGNGEHPATADSVRGVLEDLATTVGENDLLFVMLIGHGSGQGPDAKFNLVGRDLTVADWAGLLTPIRSRVAFVDATSASFPYLEGLAGEDRIVITATGSYAQRFHTQFAGAFIDALGDAEADADKNGRISLLEAFTHASRLVEQHYAQADTMSTETAMLDDTGDGVGRSAADEGDDGTVAGLTYLGVLSLPTSSDPEVQQLIQRQADLTAQVDELRRRRPSMPTSAFDAEFERLIIELSVVSRDVRRRTGG